MSKQLLDVVVSMQFELIFLAGLILSLLIIYWISKNSIPVVNSFTNCQSDDYVIFYNGKEIVGSISNQHKPIDMGLVTSKFGSFKQILFCIEDASGNQSDSKTFLFKPDIAESLLQDL